MAIDGIARGMAANAEGGGGTIPPEDQEKLDRIHLTGASDKFFNEQGEYITISVSKDFPDEFVTDGTIEDLIHSMVVYRVPTGMTYMGEVKCTNLPDGLTKAELRIDTINNKAGNTIYNFTLTSVSTEPHLWTAQGYGGYFSGWDRRPIGEDYTQEEKDKVNTIQNKVDKTDIYDTNNLVKSEKINYEEIMKHITLDSIKLSQL